MFFVGLLFVVFLVAWFSGAWMIAKKMGGQGWELYIPLYSFYFVCGRLYGNGWKILFMLIPFYNIYFFFKFYFDWAKSFHYKVGFAWGLMFLTPLFVIIMGWSNNQYGDNSQLNKSNDFINKTVRVIRLNLLMFERAAENKAKEMDVDVKEAEEPTKNSTAKPNPGDVCPKCGTPYQDGDAFCEKCGNKLS